MWKSPGHAFLASMLVPLVLACSSTSPEEPGNTGGTPGSGGQGGSSTAQPDAGPAGGTGGGGDTGGSGGSTGTGGSSATGGAGGAGDGVSCKPLTNGCTCAEVPPDPDAVKTCTATSVADKQPGSKGTCCKGGFSCKCEAFACVQDSTSNFCSCGRASSTTSVLKGPIVPDCSGAVARNPLKVKCCKSPDRCTCRESDCLAGIDEEVPNCSVSDVARCDSGQTVVPACKP